VRWEVVGGRGFRTGKNVFRIGGNTFYNRKNNFPKKILEFKRSEIRRIAESRAFLSGFPNLTPQKTDDSTIN
jgi:hypothetical protein